MICEPHARYLSQGVFSRLGVEEFIKSRGINLHVDVGTRPGTGSGPIIMPITRVYMSNKT